MHTENQVRQFYVAGASKTVAPFVAGSGTNSNLPTNTSDAGAMQLITNDDEAYFMYKGPSSDGIQRSDLIKKCNVKSVSCTTAAALAHTKKRAIVVLDSTVNSGTPIVGQDYVLNVDILNYMSLDRNSRKNKFGVARATSTTASDLYKNIAVNLAKNFAREPIQYVQISLCKSNADGNSVDVVTASNAASLTGTYVGICIDEVEQPWRRGAAPQEFIEFEVNPSTVYVAAANDDYVWGKVQMYGSSTYTDGTTSNETVASAGTIPNSKKVADMEWFFHKERGDMYGEQCFPYNIDTEYMVTSADTTNWANGYDFVDIHYYFEGNSHNVGHSEKTLTIVGAKADLKTLIGAAATTGQNPTPATGLYAFLEGTGVSIKTSTGW